MNLNKVSIEDLNLQGKRVIIRADFNVPLDETGHITDDTRIRGTLPTINYGGRGRARHSVLAPRPAGRARPAPEPRPCRPPSATPSRQGSRLRRGLYRTPDREARQQDEAGGCAAA